METAALSREVSHSQLGSGRPCQDGYLAQETGGCITLRSEPGHDENGIKKSALDKKKGAFLEQKTCLVVASGEDTLSRLR